VTLAMGSLAAACVLALLPLGAWAADVPEPISPDSVRFGR
jgi:hypothetical protein